VAKMQGKCRGKSSFFALLDRRFLRFLQDRQTVFALLDRRYGRKVGLPKRKNSLI
jgi:hypothetical protein